MDDKMGDPIDAELLAMLLEGRLSEPEKAELLARLANSDDTLAALGDAATLSLEMETELREVSENWRKKQESTLRMEAPSGEMSEGARAESGTTVVSADELQRKRKERRGKIWLWTPFVGLAAAAVIAVLINRSSGPDGPLAIADLLPRDSLAGALASASQLPGERGPGDTQAVQARLFGMALVNLGAAVKANDTASIRTAAELAHDLATEEDAREALRRIASDPAAPEGGMRQALETAEGG
ncbi:MAG TPA: hypothetical protein VFQ39_06500, partial [Longimicrobium sp.]|nr:hypothetical protein [Longimicrobium sp.]